MKNESVNSVADFPYTAYLLSYDKDIVAHALAIDIIRRARTEGAFWDLQQDDIIRIAAFSLLVKKNAGDKKMTKIDEVNKRVAEWKAEYEAQQ